MNRLFAVLVVALACTARAEEDVASLYDVTTDGSTATFKAGQKGKLVIAIKTKGGSHISAEAPLTITLKGTDVSPEKTALTLKDSVGKATGDQKSADPRFEVAVSGAAPARGQVEAKMVFFVCTEKLCARQTRNLVVPVEVQ